MLDPNKLTEKTAEAIQASVTLAKDHGHAMVVPCHLFHVLLKDDTVQRILSIAGGSKQKALSHSDVALSKLPKVSPPPSDVSFGRAMMKVLDKADSQRKDNEDTHISVDLLLLAASHDKDVKAVLEAAQVSGTSLSEAVTKIRKGQKVTSAQAEGNFDALNKFGRNLTDLAMQGKLDPVIGRDSEIRRIQEVLARRRKNNAALIGAPGTGKTAIVEGLARRIAEGDVPESLQGFNVFELDVAALIAGASYRGQAEERFKSVLKEVSEAGNVIMFIDEMHTIMGTGASGESALDLGNMIKPMLARGELRCIGATTFDEFNKYIRKDPALERRFQPVTVNEPSVEETITILRGLSDKYQAHFGVSITDGALIAAAQLSDRYITQRRLPDKAIDLLDEACANVVCQLQGVPIAVDNLRRKKMRLEVEVEALKKEKDSQSKTRLKSATKELAETGEQLHGLEAQLSAEKNKAGNLATLRKELEEAKVGAEEAERRYNLARVADLRYGLIPELEKKIQKLELVGHEGSDRMLAESVGVEQINDVVSRWTGIPVSRLSESERSKLLQLADRIKAKVVGQDDAVDAVADAVLRNRAGMSREHAPIFSGLFLGPTGTGKTELAKALSFELFGKEEILRIDCSEFQERHSVSKLIGAPAGYVGYDEGGVLTERLRRAPYSVVLFDEAEKAHADVFNILLALLDDGRVTDNKGNTVDASNAIVILTSNLGAKDFLASRNKDAVLKAVKGFFRPEFINRLDEIVVFNALEKAHLLSIVELQVESVLSKPLRKKNVSLNVSSAALRHVLESSFDPDYGARPIRRWLQREIGTQISRLLIQKGYRDSDSATLMIDIRAGELVYNFQESEPSLKKARMESDN